MSTDQLQGRKVAFVVSAKGIEEAELTTPWEAVQQAGGQPVLVSAETGEVTAVNNDLDAGGTYTAEQTTADASADDFVGLVVPGGTVNADTLRTDENAVALATAFARAGKPIAAICHGPWLLVEAGLVQNKTLTSYPSLQTDVRNAGGTWVDEEVKVCPGEGFVLVTSRNPDDLPAFCSTLVEQFAGS